MTMERDEWWSRNPDVVFRMVAGERLLVPVRGDAARTRRLFTLNPLGASVWELLEREQTFGDLCMALETRYAGVSREQVEADTGRFLAELEAFGLLKRGRKEPAHGL